MREVSSEYGHLHSMEECLSRDEGASVNFIGTVEDTYTSKSKKGTPYLRLQVQDETGVCKVMLFTQKNRDNIEICRQANGGELPDKKSIVIVKGTKKEGDTVFANLIRAQDQKIFMKLSEIKNLTS